jgi:hypothetical protein
MTNTSAQVLQLASCEHELVLRQGAVAVPQLSGASAGVSLHADGTGARMQCAPVKTRSAAKAASSSASVTISGTRSNRVDIHGARINRAVGPGAVAEQNIGGQSSVSRGSANPQPVIITVPSSWRVQARNWAGSVRAESGVWQVDVEIAAGEMSFGQLKDSRVVVDAGSVTAQSLAGRFEAHLRGAGDIEVVRSNEADLVLQLSGAGSMNFKGRASSAQIKANGVGSIEIEQVVNEPSIQASSLATIDIGR